MTSKLKGLIVLLLILLIFVFGLLINHKIPNDYPKEHCAPRNIELSDTFNMVENCDADQFIRGAVDPRYLIKPYSVRQTRPGMILMASVVMKTTTPIRNSISSRFQLTPKQLPGEMNLDELFAYFVYVGFNFIIVILSLFLFLDLVIPKQGPWATVLIGAVLIVNSIQKMFLLTPNSSILVVFIPIFCLWIFNGVLENGWFESEKIIYLSILTGFLVTGYNAFVIFIPVVILAQAFRIGLEAPKKDWINLVMRSIFITIITAIPAIVWIQYVIAKNGHFYQHEIQSFDMVVWMGTALKEGTLVSSLLQNFFQLIKLSNPYLLLTFLYLLGINGFLLGKDIKMLGEKRNLIQLRNGSVIAFLFLIFFSMVGIVFDRVAFAIIPALIVPVGQIISTSSSNASPEKLKIANITAVVFIVSLLVYEIVKVGPF
jgi:hypothetical protein